MIKKTRLVSLIFSIITLMLMEGKITYAGCPSSLPVLQAYDYVVNATDNSSGIFWEYQESNNVSSHLFLTSDSSGYYVDDDWGNYGVTGCPNPPYNQTITAIKIDDIVFSGTSSHMGLYAISSTVFNVSYSAYFYDQSTAPIVRSIPIPQVENINKDTGEADLYWSEAQSSGNLQLIAGYLLYSFKTADNDYKPTDQDNWDQINPEIITGTSFTVSGLSSDSTYFFALRIVYPDGFSTTNISGNSVGVKINSSIPSDPAENPDPIIDVPSDPPVDNLSSDNPPVDNPPSDEPKVEDQESSGIGGTIFPGAAGCGAEGHLNFGFLPLLGIFFLRKKNSDSSLPPK